MLTLVSREVDSFGQRARQPTVETWPERGLGLLVLAGTALGAILLLELSFALFTWGRFRLFDYGVYTNFMWNLANGNGFKVLVDRSYLQTHLSFTLALPALLFRIWDHPFVPALVQWLMLVAGALLEVRIMRRDGVPLPLIAAFTCWFVLGPFTQTAALAEFHGVSLFYLLGPWLHAAARRGGWRVLAPLVLTLGVREDAFVFALPILLYFARRGHARSGYLWAAACLAYGLLALFVLFPALAGMTLTERRAAVLRVALSPQALAERLRTVGWLVAPAVPLLAARGRPVLAIASLPLVVAMASGFRAQYTLSLHYSIPVVTALFVGMAEALAQGARQGLAWGARPPLRLGLAAWCIAWTALGHLSLGWLPGGARYAEFNHRPNPQGLRTAAFAATLPRHTVLLSPEPLASFAANRENILTPREWERFTGRVEQIFFTLDTLADEVFMPRLEAFLRSGEYGVADFDGFNGVLTAGHPIERNAEVLNAFARRRRTLAFDRLESRGARHVQIPLGHGVLFWPGKAGSGLWELAAEGEGNRLDMGEYRAVVRFRAGGGQGSRGPAARVELFAAGEAMPVMVLELPARDGTHDEFTTAEAELRLPRDTVVMVRVLAGDRPLWLDTLEFRPAQAGSP
jgi:uncharacterized membrane protein